MPEITLALLISLIASNAQQPVIALVRRDGKFALEVGPEAHAASHWVLERRRELLDALRLHDEGVTYDDLGREDREALVHHLRESEEWWADRIAEIASEFAEYP
ncbi:hypothetical protein [Streptomyces sp. NPDC056061]|uniref:hypothetical protein n=1 Tax=Streptomyces sp. NPDC056061 TaxID=3345700 RepID=UPI0035DD9075